MRCLTLKRLADGRTVYVDDDGNIVDGILRDGERLSVPLYLADADTQLGMAAARAKFADVVPIRRPGWRPPILDRDPGSDDEPRAAERAYQDHKRALSDAWMTPDQRTPANSDADRPPSLADTTRETRTEPAVDARLFADAHVPLADTETEYARMVQRLRDGWSLSR